MSLKNASEKHRVRQAKVESELKMGLTDPERFPAASPARDRHCFKLFKVDENLGHMPFLRLWVFFGGKASRPFLGLKNASEKQRGR